jgi:hypothetical protein
VDGERAERHLRLAAEAELRRVLAQPRRDAGHAGTPSPALPSIARLGRIAGALVAVGAIDSERVEAMSYEFRTALDVRGMDRPGLGLHIGRARRLRIQAIARRSALMTGTAVAVVSAAAGAGTATPASAAPASSAPAGTLPMRVIPVGRMFPFREEEAHGEVYFLSLVVTGDTATLPAIVRIRQPPSGPVLAAARAHVLPFQVMSATDDAGRPYNLVFSGGGGHVDAWEGHFNVHPVPPAETRCLQLVTDSGEPAIRIDLTARPRPADVRAEPVSATPGERLLDAVAQSIIVSAAVKHDFFAQPADGVGDIVAALEAAGALSVFSPAPARLAALCQRLGIDTHGITVPPAGDLPEAWTDVLAYYGRRHRPPGRDGIAALPVLLPDLGGVRFAVAGLQSRNDQTMLYVVASGLPPDHRSFPAAPSMHFGSSWWMRDNAGHWHVATVNEWTHDGTGESRFGMHVYPPLGRAVTSLELVVTGTGTRLRAHLPVSWWAAP